MKRTPSMTWLARGPPSTRTEGHDADVAEMAVPKAPRGTSAVVPVAAFHAVGSLPGHLYWEEEHWGKVEGLAAVPASSSSDEEGEALSPWAYGAEPGVDAWRPPPNCQTHDGSHPCSLNRCSFCQRGLGHGQVDIFMYRGDKAFCSLECRHHQILMDDRAAVFKLAGKRFSMVPFLEGDQGDQGHQGGQGHHGAMPNWGNSAQDRQAQAQHRGMGQSQGVPCWRPQQGDGGASNVRTFG